jgi:hypothetical protein
MTADNLRATDFMTSAVDEWHKRQDAAGLSYDEMRDASSHLLGQLLHLNAGTPELDRAMDAAIRYIERNRQ